MATDGSRTGPSPIEVALFNVEHSLWPTLDKRPNLPIGSQSPATSSGLGAIFGPHQLHAVHTSAGHRSTPERSPWTLLGASMQVILVHCDVAHHLRLIVR